MGGPGQQGEHGAAAAHRGAGSGKARPEDRGHGSPGRKGCYSDSGVAALPNPDPGSVRVGRVGAEGQRTRPAGPHCNLSCGLTKSRTELLGK